MAERTYRCESCGSSVTAAGPTPTCANCGALLKFPDGRSIEVRGNKASEVSKVAARLAGDDLKAPPRAQARNPWLSGSFAAAITAGVPFVMVSLATYDRIDPDHLAVFSPTVIDGMLRGDLGFRGVVISDALGATAVAGIPPGDRAIAFLRAGGDMIISNQVAPAIAMARAVTAQAGSSASLRDRIDESTLLVLEAKQAAGLLDCD